MLLRDGEDWILTCRVLPRAKAEGWVVSDDAVTVRLKTPPVDGKANARLKRFLANEFGTAPSRVVIERGQTKRHKRIRIHAARKVPGELS